MTTSNQSLVAKFAGKFSIEPDKLMTILKATCFKQKGEAQATNEQVAALLVVADQYGLNPFCREIFAFPDKQNGIVPVVGLDGWSRIINDHAQMDGIEYNVPPMEEWVFEDDDAKECPEWIECVIHRKDRSKPIVVREYLDEVYRPLGTYPSGDKMKPGPWQSHTKRFLRHKATIQCARLAFGFGGIFDQDEAERIVDMGDVVPASTPAVVVEMPMAKGQAALTHTEPQTLDLPIQREQAEVVEVVRETVATLADAVVEQRREPVKVPLPKGMRTLVEKKMADRQLTEANLQARFDGLTLDGITLDNVNDVLEWLTTDAADA